MTEELSFWMCYCTSQYLTEMICDTNHKGSADILSPWFSYSSPVMRSYYTLKGGSKGLKHNIHCLFDLEWSKTNSAWLQSIALLAVWSISSYRLSHTSSLYPEHKGQQVNKHATYYWCNYSIDSITSFHCIRNSHR